MRPFASRAGLAPHPIGGFLRQTLSFFELKRGWVREVPSRAGFGAAAPIAKRICCAVLALGVAGSAAAQAPLVAFTVTGDAIAEPLGGRRGDAARGKAVVFDGERGNCTICHPVPGGDARTQGNVAPTLAGVALRLTEGQMRLRLVDGTRINAATIMPPYYRIDGLNRVGEAFRGRPALSAAEIEDIIAFLQTLKE